jgi:hypothetical protein
MRKTLLFIILVLIILPFNIIVASHPLTSDDNEKSRIKKLIDKLVEYDYIVPQEGMANRFDLKKESVPILLEFATDSTYSVEFHRQALVLLKEIPDNRILAPLTRYYRDCAQHPGEPCDNSPEMRSVLASYYSKTKDENALTLFIEMLQDNSWPLPYKLDAVRILSLCIDARTTNILKSLVIDNPSYPVIYHLNYAHKLELEDRMS